MQQKVTYNATMCENCTVSSAPSAVFQDATTVVLLCVAYSFVFVLGLVNNSLIILVIRRNPRLQTITNTFIVNLAVADILVCLLVLPITLLTNIYREWLYGAFLCKVAPYLQGVAVSASVNTMAAVALERYLAIVHLHRPTHRINERRAYKMIIMIWLFAITFFFPWLIVYHQRVAVGAKHDIVICTQSWSNDARKVFILLIFLVCYIIPLLFIAACYLLIGIKVCQRRPVGNSSRVEQVLHKTKIRIVRMLVVVCFLFAISWLPRYAIQLRTQYNKISKVEGNIYKSYLIPLTQWIGASNSCVNPFIYCYFSSKFRQSVFELLSVVAPCFRSQNSGVVEVEPPTQAFTAMNTLNHQRQPATETTTVKERVLETNVCHNQEKMMILENQNSNIESSP